MSEKTKGWMGWMSKLGLQGEYEGPVVWMDGPRSELHYPVYVIPLRPDGPLPGEVWRCDSRKRDVTIVGPAGHNAFGDVTAWWCSWDNVSPIAIATSSLSRPPITKTVTVELTEEEIQGVKKVAGDVTMNSRVHHLAAKLAAVLEDE